GREASACSGVRALNFRGIAAAVRAPPDPDRTSVAQFPSPGRDYGVLFRWAVRSGPACGCPRVLGHIRSRGRLDIGYLLALWQAARFVRPAAKLSFVRPRIGTGGAAKR